MNRRPDKANCREPELQASDGCQVDSRIGGKLGLSFIGFDEPGLRYTSLDVQSNFGKTNVRVYGKIVAAADSRIYNGVTAFLKLASKI